MAIDGPGASGKSTVGWLVAQRLGCRFVDTGGMYRAITWLALVKGLNFEDEAALVQLAEETTLLVLPGTLAHPGGRFLVGTEDVSSFLHRPDVDAKVSQAARIPGVRRIMVEAQQRLAEQGGIVMAGRDIGTAVLPDAELKIYLDASVEERARRRLKELQEGGASEADYQKVLEELRRRDEVDRGRETSPLRPAGDALIVRTDGLSPEQVAMGIVEAACVGRGA